MTAKLSQPVPVAVQPTPHHASPQRVAERVTGILTDRIRSGLYSDGELLPTERSLSADLGVHRRSVRTAVDNLVREGLVFRRPNCRPTVGSSEIPSTNNHHSAGSKSSPPQISTSNLIALIMWHGGGPLEHAGTSQQRIFWGMNQALMKIGYHAVFLDLGSQIGTEEENARREAEHLRYVRDQGFGGALFYPYAYRSNRDLVQEVAETVPIVLLDRRIDGANVDFVGIENYRAEFELTSHLIEQGHKRIAYVTRHEPIRSVQDRLQGYIDAIRTSTVPGLVEITLPMPPFNRDGAWIVFDATFRLPEGQRPTATVCFTDYMAVNVAERLEHLGLRCPEDVALTGFDNIVPALPNGVGLTTVAQPYEDIGTAAVDLLMRRIKDRSRPPTSLELPVSVTVRASSTSFPR